MKGYERVEIKLVYIDVEVFCGTSGEGWRDDENDDGYVDSNFGS